MPQSTDQLLSELRTASSDLDSLLQEVSLGVRSARRYDELEERGQAIAAMIAQAFRGSAARPSTVLTKPGRNGGHWFY